MSRKRGRSVDSMDQFNATAVSGRKPEEDQSEWQRTLQQAIKAIVSIRFSQVSAFDTESPETSEATGFVVDKHRGIILTNRHGV
jgi:S1-C subfamily serine protease